MRSNSNPMTTYSSKTIPHPSYKRRNVVTQNSNLKSENINNPIYLTNSLLKLELSLKKQYRQIETKLGKIGVNAKKNTSDIISALLKINDSIKSLENLLSDAVKRTLPKDSLDSSSNNSFYSASETKSLAKYKRRNNK